VCVEPSSPVAMTTLTSAAKFTPPPSRRTCLRITLRTRVVCPPVKPTKRCRQHPLTTGIAGYKGDVEIRSAEVNALARRALGADGLELALQAVAQLRDELERLEAAHVAHALDEGWSWSEIADSLGVSKQAAHRKHRGQPRAPRRFARSARPAGRVLLTAEIRSTMHKARQEAAALGHRCVRPDHIVLALLRERSGPVADAMQASGAEHPAAASAAAAIPDPAEAQGPGITRDTRTVLEDALRQAVARREGWLGQEHLLLALLHHDAGRAALTRAGSDPEQLYDQLERRLLPAADLDASGSRHAPEQPEGCD
jgi:ATP-dependent Clp protease ATP-binding subunit ClpA